MQALATEVVSADEASVVDHEPPAAALTAILWTARGSPVDFLRWSSVCRMVDRHRTMGAPIGRGFARDHSNASDVSNVECVRAGEVAHRMSDVPERGRAASVSGSSRPWTLR